MVHAPARPLDPHALGALSLRLVAIACFLLIGSVGFAQLASGTDPAETADQAVQAWLEQETPDLQALLGRPAEDVCRELPALLGSPPPPEGTQVNLEDRQPRTTESESTRAFTYPAERPGGELDVVQVDLAQEGDGWIATSVGFRVDQPTGRPWLNQPVVWALFLLVSIAALYLSVRPTFFRGWVREGVGLLRRHRGIFIGTMILVYGAFALGAFTGSTLPDACAEAVLTVLQGSLESAGATQAVESGNVLRAAVTIFYQNFVVVNLVLFFTLAVLFGLPAYLGAAVVLFVNGIPFGLIGDFGPLSLVFVAVLVILELTAHAVVVAGGGILVRTLVKEGFAAFSEGIRRLALMVPLSFLLLLIGAWYESFLLVPGM